MALITKIEIQQKNKSRFNVYIDRGQGEEYAFSVHEHVLVRHRLQKGMTIEASLYARILAEEEVNKAYLHGIHYLSYRMRSEKEVYTYLKKKQYDDEAIARAVAQLKDERYIDDVAFAKAYVATKKNTTTKGTFLIEQELLAKGLNEEAVAAGMKKFTYSEQVEKASAWAQKKIEQWKRLSKREQELKLKSELFRKGYCSDVIEAVFCEIDIQIDEAEEWKALTYHGERALKKYRHLQEYERKMKVKQSLYRRGFSLAAIERFVNDKLWQ